MTTIATAVVKQPAENDGPGDKEPAENDGRGGLAVSVSGGVQGVIGNVFAQDEVHLTKLNSRFDTCFETNCCCVVGACNIGWFLKIPDCIGAGCSSACVLGKCDCTLRLLQSPVCCDCLSKSTCIDLGSFCNCKEDMCVRLMQCAGKCSCCFICSCAYDMDLGLMKTLLKGWLWAGCCDCRCAIPCQKTFAPPGCGICGWGWRMGQGCGCQAPSIRPGGAEDASW